MANQGLVTSGPFVIRSAEAIAQSLIDYFVACQTGVTDLSTGSVIRTEFEALADLAENFYADLGTTLQDAIVQSAYTAFNFVQLPFDFATGYLAFKVLVSPTAPIVFNPGTTWQPTGLDITFQTTTGFTIPPGALVNSYWHVPARCTSPGTVGNIEPGVTGDLLYPSPGISVIAEDGTDILGTIVAVGPVGPGVPTITFPLQKGFLGGTDPESPLEMKTRFTSFLSSLHRSTGDALEYGASLGKVYNANGDIIEQVVKAKTIDVNNDYPAVLTHTGVPYACQNAGDVRIFIFNGVGSTNGQVTSQNLKGAAQSVIDGTIAAASFVPGYKAAGMPTTVEIADEYIVTPTIQVTRLGSGTATVVSSDFLSEAIGGPGGAIDSYFKALGIGDAFYTSGLIGAISQVPGVLAVNILALTVKRQWDNTVVLATVGNYQPPLNGIVISDNLATIRGLLTWV